MSEREVKPTAEAGALGAAAPNDGEAFRRAASLVGVQSDDSNERARQAFSSIEEREAADRQSSPATSSETLAQSTAEDQGGAETEIDEAIDDKALEDAVADANDTARIVGDLTPHNL